MASRPNNLFKKDDYFHAKTIDINIEMFIFGELIKKQVVAVDISQIETKVLQLVEKCKRLEKENIEMRHDFQEMQVQCKRLQEKHALAIDSVEEMIKSLHVAEEQS